MSVLEQIRDFLPEYSRSERKIADYILQYPFDIQKFTGESLAEKCNVSRSAIIRFCHKLGFSGYSDFRYALLSEPIQKKEDTSSPTNPQMNKTLGYYDQVIQTLRESDAPEKAEALAEAIMHSSRIVTFGQFHSNLSAQQLTYRLLRRNINSIYLNDITNFESYTRLLNPGDVVIIFSISSHESYDPFIKVLKEKRVIVALFTMREESPLKNIVDIYTTLPSAIHFGEEYLLDDAISFFLAIELIMEAIYRKYGNGK